MNQIDINEKKEILKALVDNSLRTIVSETAKKARKKIEEPDFIAALSIDFTKQFYQILKTVFPSIIFSVSSVYCHQKPLASFTCSTKSTEIGDILFIYRYIDKYGGEYYNSLLFQAKISQNPILKLDLPNDQYTLYSKWPDFTYLRAGYLNGKKISILPKTITRGAQYLLIDDHPVLGLSGAFNTFPFGTALAVNPITIEKNLSEEIIDFISFNTGRFFEADPQTTKDGWTKMIWNLIDIAKTKNSKRKNIGVKFSRLNLYQLDGYGISPQEKFSIFTSINNNNNISPQEIINNEAGGISIIIIESNYQEFS